MRNQQLFQDVAGFLFCICAYTMFIIKNNDRLQQERIQKIKCNDFLPCGKITISRAWRHRKELNYSKSKRIVVSTRWFLYLSLCYLRERMFLNTTDCDAKPIRKETGEKLEAVASIRFRY